MNANDILGIFLAAFFLIVGTYFNYKFKQIDKDDKPAHKKV